MFNNIKTEKKRIRVMICINNLYVGGAQRQLQKQLPYFNTDKFDITILSFDVNSQRKNISIEFPDKITHYQIKMNNLWDLRGWYRSFVLIGKIRPDVIMTSMFWTNTIGRVMGLFYRIPVIARYHNTVAHSSSLQKKIDSFLARYTSKFVGVSSDVANFIIEEIPSVKDRMLVVPNGIDIENIKLNSNDAINKIRQVCQADANTILLLSVGRLVEQKNHSLMIKGFSEIKKNYPSTKLCLVGDGDYRLKLEKLINNLNLSDSVYLAGHQDNVNPFYEAADLYISTSKREGMSNTQLEAIVHGLPIIATKTGGTAELIIEYQNGFIISEPSPEGVLSAYKKYFKHDKLLLRKKAREQAVKFDIKNTVKMYENLWEVTSQQV